MDPKVARALSLIGLRVNRLEKVITEYKLLSREKNERDDDVPLRYANMFEDIGIENETISGSPLLVNLYRSENLKLSSHCIGTWPDEKQVHAAICLFGGNFVSGSSQPCEEVRLNIIPELIQRQVPFSLTQTDHDEDIPIDKVASILRSAPSHLIIDSRGSCNFINRVLTAYLLGRGNGMVYRITRACITCENKHVNLYGPDRQFSDMERLTECDKLLMIMSKDNVQGVVESYEFCSFLQNGEQGGFLDAVLNVKPDALSRHEPQSVAARRQHWNEILDSDESVATDMGYMLVCAYLSGMLSPCARSPYTPVPKDVIGNIEAWLGHIKTMMYVNRALHTEDGIHNQSEVREALAFLSHLLRAEE